MSDNLTTINVDGYTIQINTNDMDQEVRKNEVKNEKWLVSNLLSNLKNDDIFFDIGANIGTHSIFASKIISSGEIHCFEPHPSNHSILQNNLNINNVDNVIIHNIALFDIDGNKSFDIIEDKTGEVEGYLSSKGSINVPTKQIKNMDLPQPNVIKIDVEGAEMRVLNGMNNDIIQSIRTLYIEAHTNKMEKYYNNNITDIIKFAEENNFNMKHLFKRRTQIFLKLEGNRDE